MRYHYNQLSFFRWSVFEARRKISDDAKESIEYKFFLVLK